MDRRVLVIEDEPKMALLLGGDRGSTAKVPSSRGRLNPKERNR